MTDLLTPAAAAKTLAISVKQLHDLTVAGEIAFVNIGLGHKRPTRRYLQTDIDDFIARRRTTELSKPSGKHIRNLVLPSSEIVDFREILHELREARRKAAADRRRK